MRKKVQKQQRVEIQMDVTLYAKMQAKLFSPLEEKVPYGAVARYLNELVRRDLENSNGQQAGGAVVAGEVEEGIAEALRAAVS